MRVRAYLLCCVLSGVSVTSSAALAPQAAAPPAAAPHFVCPPCGCASDGKTFAAAGLCPSCGMDLVRSDTSTRSRKVAILLFDGVELLDFAGPAEVFEATRGAQANPFYVFTVAADAGPLTSQGFLTITPRFSIADAPNPDILVIPGGNVGRTLGDARMIDWIRARAAECEMVMSVCNGALVLARAGLLDGLEATTHHSAIEALRREAPRTRVLDSRRYIDNGRVVTTAGVSAGIDGALAVVERLLGPEAATATARYMEYERRPSPAP